MKLLIFGAPGAGKGTQAKLICEKLNIEHISTGDLMRAEVREGTELGKELDAIMSRGDYVSDDTTFELLKKKLTGKVLEEGFLLDGYPRTMEQVKMLEKIVGEVDKAIEIQIDNEVIIKRLSTRRVCDSCGKIYNAVTDGLETGDKCKTCEGKLYQRKDDTEEAIKIRLETYEKSTKPLINYYENKGQILSVDGVGIVEEVNKRILKKLGV